MSGCFTSIEYIRRKIRDNLMSLKRDRQLKEEGQSIGSIEGDFWRERKRLVVRGDKEKALVSLVGLKRLYDTRDSEETT